MFKKRLSLAVATCVLAACAGRGRSQPVTLTWPATIETSAGQLVSARTESSGVTTLVAVFPAMMLHNGRLARCIYIAAEQTDDRVPLLRAHGFFVARLDQDFEVVAGDSDARATAKPRDGLTW